jgi:phospholipid/cholesterol/gamma-HCH transport system substrate-binding protein
MKRVRVAATLLAATLGLSACGIGSGLYNVPLPGGANLGSHPYTVTAVFSDVLDLVPQSSVKVNNVAVGRVTKIGVINDGRQASVELEVTGNTHLPANATAAIMQTSLLGEKYVALAAPPVGATGQLTNGARITSTSTGVEAEQVLGALALLLSGGGVGQLNDITVALNQWLKGNETNVRGFLDNLQQVVGQLNEHRDSITKALDALGTLSVTLNNNRGTIDSVLANLSPGIAELARQRQQLIGMLEALNRLSTVTVSTIDQSQTAFVQNLKSLGPILKNLNAAGSAFPQSLQALLTYPFTDASLNGIKGDYLNGWVTTMFNTTVGATTISVENWVHSTTTGASPTTTPPTIPPPPSLLPGTSSVAPGVPASTITSDGSSSASSSGSSSASSSASSSGSPTPSSSGGGS